MPPVRACALAALAAVLIAGPARAQIPLAPGGFPPLPGTRLGAPETFLQASVLPEIPPVSTRCVPLIDEAGDALAWLSAAAQAGDRLLVRRCVDGPAPADGLPAGARRGGAAREWEAVERVDGGGLSVTPLRLPDWSFFSNPAFCGARAAYWAFRGEELYVQVYDLDAARVLASARRGVLQVVADETDTLDAPVWRADCTEAVFRAARLGRREVVIAIP
jgi:hypothetical protein